MSFKDPSTAVSGSYVGHGGRSLSVDDLVLLNDEIRALARAGIPLDIGLRETEGRTRGAVRSVSESLASQLEAGVPLDEALKSEEPALPATYRAVVAAGLRTGRLDEILSSLSNLAESTASLQRQMRLSLIYPTILLGLAYALFVAFVMFLVPQLQRAYEIFNIEESNWVNILLWLYRTAQTWIVTVPAIIAGLVLLWWLAGRILPARGKRLLPGHWMPGGRDLSLARFTRMLSLLVEHNVPLPECFRLAAQSTGERPLQAQAEQLASAIESGSTLSEAINSARQIPAFLRWLIAVGDRQGTLAASLRQAAELHEQRALVKLDWFRRVVPPLIVLGCCGSITLLYGLTLFVPLTELIRSIGQS